MQERQKAVQIWQNNSQRRNALLVYQEKEAPSVLFTNLLPHSLLLLQFWTNPAMSTGDLRCWKLKPFTYLQPAAPFVQCSLRYPAETSTSLNDCRLRALSVRPGRTARRSSLITMKNSSTNAKLRLSLRWPCFYQNNVTKYSIENAGLSLEEKMTDAPEQQVMLSSEKESRQCWIEN